MVKKFEHIADTVFLNGYVYTVDPKCPKAEAVAIKKGRFIAVGNVSEISACTGPGTQIIDLKGKMVLPGFIDSHAHASCATAFLLEPYAHMPDTCGEPLWNLDALAHARNSNGVSDARHLITHLHIVDPVDIPRMADLDVIGAPQPFWFVKGDYFHNLEARYLGLERAENEYPMKSLKDAGVLLAGASDYPVQVPSPPPLGIMLGVTRCEPGETNPNEILGPEERMTLKEMIECFTIDGARANFLEEESGSIEVSKKADMVVLEKNLFEIPETDIADTKVMMTVFEGNTVYRDTTV